MSLWAEIDDTLVALLTDEMGASSAHATLKLATIQLGEVWEPDRWTHPSALVRSTMASDEADAHGADDTVGLLALYEYQVVLVVDETGYATARANAQTLRDRFRAILRETGAGSLWAASSGDESVGQVRFGRSLLEVRGRQGGTAGRYYGIAVIEFVVEADI